jgi:hypothetical protein
MDGYITFSQLGQLIAFMVVVVACGYVIMTFRNVNTAVKNILTIMKDNQEAINQVIPNIAKASGNVVAITSDLQAGLGETGKAVETSSDPFPMYAMVIGETAKALVKFFTVNGNV